MKYSDLEKYFLSGYKLSPFYEENNLDEYESFELKNISINDLKNSFLATEEGLAIEDLLKATNYEDVLLYKIEDSYHITIEDLLYRLNNELDESEYGYSNKDYIIDFLHYLDWKDDSKPIYLPDFSENEIYKLEDRANDFLYDDDDHLIRYVIYILMNRLNNQNIEEMINKAINFIEDILSQRDKPYSSRCYKKETYDVLISEMSYLIWENPKYDYPSKFKGYYKDMILKCAKEEMPIALKALGFEYYEGDIFFERNYYNACRCFERCFNLTGDPDVTRPLGYIYYYGRVNGGIPEKEKAFQYFAIGHIAGQYFESTYKLADCYVNGYGTPISHKAAYELVSSIYSESYDLFSNEEESKFADLALRMGSYYQNGIYVEKNLFKALYHYIDSRAALKERIKKDRYVGDTSVAYKLYKSIQTVKNELAVENRIIKNKGYVFKNKGNISLSGYDFSFDLKDGYLYIYVLNNKEKTGLRTIFEIPSIYFSEVANYITFAIHPLDNDLDNFVNSLKSSEVKNVHFEENELFIETDSDVPFFLVFDEIMVIPSTLNNLEKCYKIATCQVNDLNYVCLLQNKNVAIDNIVKIENNSKVLEGKVLSIDDIYEDEIPIPIDKIAVIK